MPKKKIVLRIPRNLVGEPIVYHLVKEYDLVVNVLRAQVMNDEEGKIVVEVEGSKESLEQGMKYLRSRGVHLEMLGKDIRVDDTLCIDCGACTAVCSPRALSLDKTTWKLQFDRQRCVLCELCVTACPIQAIKVAF